MRLDFNTTDAAGHAHVCKVCANVFHVARGHCPICACAVIPFNGKNYNAHTGRIMARARGASGMNNIERHFSLGSENWTRK